MIAPIIGCHPTPIKESSHCDEIGADVTVRSSIIIAIVCCNNDTLCSLSVFCGCRNVMTDGGGLIGRDCKNSGLGNNRFSSGTITKYDE